MTYREIMLKHNNDPELRKWILTRPAKIRRAFLKYPPNCYLSNKNMGHYRLHSYEENTNDSVTVKLVHGRDSYSPGILVFGVPLNSLILCGCGKWESPTKAQVKETKKWIDSEVAKRKKDN